MEKENIKNFNDFFDTSQPYIVLDSTAVIAMGNLGFNPAQCGFVEITFPIIEQINNTKVKLKEFYLTTEKLIRPSLSLPENFEEGKWDLYEVKRILKLMKTLYKLKDIIIYAKANYPLIITIDEGITLSGHRPAFVVAPTETEDVFVPLCDDWKSKEETASKEAEA